MYSSAISGGLITDIAKTTRSQQAKLEPPASTTTGRSDVVPGGSESCRGCGEKTRGRKQEKPQKQRFFKHYIYFDQYILCSILVSQNFRWSMKMES